MFHAIEKKAFIILSVCLIILDATFVYINYTQDEKAFEEELNEEGQRLKTAFDVAYSLTLSNMSQIGSYVANDPDVQEIFAQAAIAFKMENGDKNGPETLRWRTALNDEVSNSWRHMRERFSVRQLHFHLPPGDTSLLRVHRPQKWGDDLSSIRHLIVDTHADQQPRQGFELGRVYAGVRGVVPVFAPKEQPWNGQFVGALEAGTSFSEIIRNLENQIGADVMVLIKKGRVQEAKWANEFDVNFVTECGCFVEANSEEKTPRFLSDLDLEIVRKGEGNKLLTAIHEVDGNYYSVTHFGLQDYIGIRDGHSEPVARIVMWSDATPRIVTLESKLATNIGYAVIAFLIFELVLVYVIHAVHGKFRKEISDQAVEIVSLNALAQENAERLEVAGSVAYDLIYEWDVASDSLVWFGDIDKLLGFEHGEISQDISAWLNLIHPDDRDQLSDAVERHRTETSAISYEYRIRNREGVYRYWSDNAHPFVDENGKPYKWVGVCADITEQRNAKNDLALFFEQPMNLHLVASLQGDILRANKGWENALGYTAEELGGHKFLEFVHEDDIEATLAEMSKLADGQTTFYFENRYKHKNGQYRVLAWSAVAVPEDNKVYAVATDVTVRKMYEEELKRAKKTAERASQAKSEFLANMSHELRTPMTGIRGVLDLLRENQVISNEAQDLLDDLDVSSKALSTLLNDILDLSKIEAGKLTINREPCALDGVISNIVHIFEPLAIEKGVKLAFEIEELEQKWFMLDGLRIRQILTNLLNNAVKFTHEGQITLSGVYEDGMLRVTITDTGIGLTEDQKSAIFARFSQADQSTTRKYGGTGLGLSISRELASMMGGQLELLGSNQDGSSFCLVLPTELTQESASLHIEDVVLPPLNILLAEDNIINQKVVKSMLEKQGHTVDVAQNGKEAVIMAEKQDFDVILMDMQMPEMGGEEATSIIRTGVSANASKPIFAFTADAISEHQERYLASGVDDIIVKPVKWNDLRMKFAQYIAAE